MSDVMLCGILRMPFDDYGDFSLAQLKQACREAADELERRADEISRLQAENTELLEALNYVADSIARATGVE